MSGRSPSIYCTLTLIAMQGHQKTFTDKNIAVHATTKNNVVHNYSGVDRIVIIQYTIIVQPLVDEL